MRFGIIGCGGIAKWHTNAISGLDNCEVTAVCDIRENTAQELATEYNATAFCSVDAMLESGLVDAVAICTPSGMHAEYAIKALKKGIHAIVEKPMAITKQSLDELIDTADRSRAELFPISQLRCLDDIKQAKKIIESGQLGRITLCDLSMKYYREPSYYESRPWRGTWEMDGGGALMNQGIHGLDLMRYICGEIAGIASFKDTLYHKIQTEDTLAASLKFENGALGVVTAGTAAYPGFERRLEICGTDGSIVLNEGNISRLIIKGQEQIVKSASAKNGASNPLAIDYEPHLRQYKNIYAHITGGEKLVVDAQDAAKTIELILEMYKSEG